MYFFFFFSRIALLTHSINTVTRPSDLQYTVFISHTHPVSISVIFLIFLFPRLFPLWIFLLISLTKIPILTSDVCFSFTGVYLADDRRQKGDGVFSAAACEVSTILPQLLEIAHCLVSSFEIHIRMGCTCVHRYASTTGVILGLELSLIHALKWNRLFAAWVFWVSRTLCCIWRVVRLRECSKHPKRSRLSYYWIMVR